MFSRIRWSSFCDLSLLSGRRKKKKAQRERENVVEVNYTGD